MAADELRDAIVQAIGRRVDRTAAQVALQIVGERGGGDVTALGLVVRRLRDDEVELARDAIDSERDALLHPDQAARTPFVTTQLEGAPGPVVAVSDYMRAVPLQIAPWVPGDFHALGTDGFGFADTRPAARRFFNVDAPSVVVQTLQALARRGEVKPEVVTEAFAKYRINDPTAVRGVAQEGGDA